MKRLLAALLAGLLTVVAALTAGPPPAKVQISWHGQSFFQVKSSKGTNIVLDPHQIQEYGRLIDEKGRPVKIVADAILMSHPHDDHTQVEVVANAKDPKTCKIIPGWKGTPPRTAWNIVDEKVKDVHIRSVGVYHDTEQGLKRGKNTVFILEVDGLKVVHLGDLGHLLTPKQLKEIGPVDVLMVPVGGVYTINGSEAKQVVAQLKPRKYIIPMHYGTKVFDELLSAEEFLDGQKPGSVVKADDNTLFVSKNPNPGEPFVAVLHYWPKVQKKAKALDKDKKDKKK